jgi:hypothetical protein
MMHLTFADKDLITGDSAAEMLLEYTAALARNGTADTVKLACLGADGDEVVATFVLGEGTPLMGETSHSSQPEPDNEQAISYMRSQMDRLRNPRGAMDSSDFIVRDDDRYLSDL